MQHSSKVAQLKDNKMTVSRNIKNKRNFKENPNPWNNKNENLAKDPNLHMRKLISMLDSLKYNLCLTSPNLLILVIVNFHHS